VEYYPDQLKAFATLCETLNEFDRQTNDSSVFLPSPIAVADGNDPDRAIGHLVDEIGGSWSFRPVEPDSAEDEDEEDEDDEDEDEGESE
jgi:hypothetical protein